jgi:hypothetical protein
MDDCLKYEKYTKGPNYTKIELKTLPAGLITYLNANVAGYKLDYAVAILKDSVIVEYTKSDDMCVDIYTKHITDGDKWKKLTRMINVVDPRDLCVRERDINRKATNRRGVVAKARPGAGRGASLRLAPAS